MDRNDGFTLFTLLTPKAMEEDREELFKRSHDWKQAINYCTCNQCGADSTLRYVNGSAIYGASYEGIDILECRNCSSYVGVHENRKFQPKGTLADTPTRKGRIKCHEMFDKLWQSKNMSRNESYDLLAGIMGLPKELAHFGYFNESQCTLFFHVMGTSHLWDHDNAVRKAKSDKTTGKGWGKLDRKLTETEIKRSAIRKGKRW